MAPWFLAFLGTSVAFATALRIGSRAFLAPLRTGGLVIFLGFSLVGWVLLARGLILGSAWAPEARSPSQGERPVSKADVPRWLGFVRWVLGASFVLPFLLYGDWRLRLSGLLIGFYLGEGWLPLFRFLLQRAKFGSSSVRFDRTPFHPGEELTLYFQDVDRLREATLVCATLRYVAEVWELRDPTMHGRGWFSIRYARYEEDRIFRPGRPGEVAFGSGEPARIFRFGRRQGPGTEWPLRFVLPADDRLVDRLADGPAHYWELAVWAKLPGIDYVATFHLPVYARAESDALALGGPLR